MVKLYDFGADISDVGINERQVLAWPIAVWSCYIPESEGQNINILEHLILQLVNKKIGNPKEILCRQIGFNEELIDAAIEECANKGYFDRRFHGELTLSSEGKGMLGKFDNPYNEDLEASKKAKKVYMIQDLVTKSVVPIFDLTVLPRFYYDDDNAIEIKYEKDRRKKPKSASIKTALRYWSRLCNNEKHGYLPGNNAIDMSSAPQGDLELEDFIPFSDEVDWETLADSVEESAGVKTLADKEEEEREEKEGLEIKNITILDDTPEFYYARAFVAINRNNPDEVIVISPFGRKYDDWFRTVINRIRINDNKFEEDIQLFLMDKRESLKDVIAFSNDLNIALFNRFPFISNNPEFVDLKRAVETVARARDGIVAGSDETHHFISDKSTALQIALRHVFDRHHELFQNNLTYDNYKLAIKGLVGSYGLSDDLARNFLPADQSIYNNAVKCSNNSGHITGYCALLLVDAWDNKSGKAMDLIKAMPEFPQIILDITRPRNTSTHGNKGKNGRKGYAEMYVTKDEAIKGYDELETLLTAIYSRFMEDR